MTNWSVVNLGRWFIVMLKKQLIMETAIELFAAKGIESTPIQQITEQCGISKGAFYLSFKSKDELIMSIIDYFMKNFTMKIDQAVTRCKNPVEKLYTYYLTSFEMMEQNADFTQVFIKEQLYSIDEALINKMTYYETFITKTLHRIIVELNGEKKNKQQHDLIFIIKGFIGSYAHLIIGANQQLDLHKLCESLVEKTNCIIQYSKTSFITEDMLKHSLQSPHVTKEDLLKELQVLYQDVEDEVILDSLTILNEQINSEVPRKAIMNGMLLNLQKDTRCNWFAYIIRHYFEQ